MLWSLSKKRPYKDIPDAELIARYQRAQDAACFEELFARYKDKVFLICFKLLRNKEESQDACMEIFEKAGKALPQNQVEKLNDWLFVVAKNHCYDQLRRRKLRLATGMDDEELEEILWKKGHGERPYDDDMDRQDQLDEVAAAMSRLEETQRICVDEFYRQGKSYKMIAEETGYTLNQVKSYLQNGIRNLRIMLNHGKD
jgi:RNA polymerase sigma-70 factor (ECF subfamily)